MNIVFDKLYESKIVPVVALDKVDNAVPLANALVEGGIKSIEVTFRTEAAECGIKEINKNCPDILVGAGTVVNIDQAKRAVNAGAKFLVSPGLSKSVIEYSLENNIPILPGVCTPSEIITAMDYELSVLKFFPAKQYGGLKTIKALAPVFPTIKFMPTGGINIDNLSDFLSEKEIFACGGSWMVKADLIKKADFEIIKKLSEEAMRVANSIR